MDSTSPDTAQVVQSGTADPIVDRFPGPSVVLAGTIRAVLGAASWLLLVAVLAWQARVIFLEGYQYRLAAGFPGDFKQAFVGWGSDRGIFYGPIFELERLYLWLPGYISMVDVARLDFLLFGAAFVVCWRVLFPAGSVKLFLFVLVMWVAHVASLQAFASAAHLEILELLLLSVALLFATRGRPVAEGVSVGLAMATKTLPVLFLFALVARRRWRALLGAISLAALLVALVCAVKQISLLDGVVSLVFQEGNLGKLTVIDDETSIRADIARFVLRSGYADGFTPDQARLAFVLGAGVGLVSLISAAWVFYRVRRAPDGEGLLYGVVCALMLILSPSGHIFYLVLLLPGWTAALAELLRRPLSGTSLVLWAMLSFSYTFSGFQLPFLAMDRVLGVGVGFVQQWSDWYLGSAALLVDFALLCALLMTRSGALGTRPSHAPAIRELSPQPR